MDIDRSELAIYVYNVALVMSGAFLVVELGIEDPLAMGGMAVVVGLVWSVYYHFSMMPRLEAMRQGVFIPEDEEFLDEEDDDSPDEDEDHDGAQAPWES
ncbi:hypothetical protein [Halorhabdus salina]|uniref:hypothetical protein n=1 Tax=Halorhabdus salina TaxID=2750670 RepID=UPI0015EED07E|nr:hypothetical protein [Halorhabdus salina]